MLDISVWLIAFTCVICQFAMMEGCEDESEENESEVNKGGERRTHMKERQGSGEKCEKASGGKMSERAQRKGPAEQERKLGKRRRDDEGSEKGEEMA